MCPPTLGRFKGRNAHVHSKLQPFMGLISHFTTSDLEVYPLFDEKVKTAIT